MVYSPIASQSLILNGSRIIGYCDYSLFFSSSLGGIGLIIDRDVSDYDNERGSYLIG